MTKDIPTRFKHDLQMAAPAHHRYRLVVFGLKGSLKSRLRHKKLLDAYSCLKRRDLEEMSYAQYAR